MKPPEKSPRLVDRCGDASTSRAPCGGFVPSAKREHRGSGGETPRKRSPSRGSLRGDASTSRVPCSSSRASVAGISGRLPATLPAALRCTADGEWSVTHVWGGFAPFCQLLDAVALAGRRPSLGRSPQIQTYAQVYVVNLRYWNWHPPERELPLFTDGSSRNLARTRRRVR